MLSEMLNPNRFTEMSPKMAAIVGYIIGASFTDPEIVEIVITSDGHVLARQAGEIGLNDYIGTESDLVRNWRALLDAADLDNILRKSAERCYAARIRRA